MLVLGLILLAGVATLVVGRYNALQTLAQGVREAHANVMASMKKRIDLANKLIDIVRGYADHEKLTHISVAGAGDTIAEGGVGAAAAGAVNQVVKLANQYPDLKANATYQQLMGQLDQIELDLQARRETYNARVKAYNTALLRLPVSLYARQLGFQPAPYFDVDNADSLEKLKDFHSDDAEHLKRLLADGGRKLADGSRKIADESVKIGRIALDKGIDKSAEFQGRRASGGSGSAGGDPGPAGPSAPAAAKAEDERG